MPFGPGMSRTKWEVYVRSGFPISLQILQKGRRLLDMRWFLDLDMIQLVEREVMLQFLVFFSEKAS